MATRYVPSRREELDLTKTEYRVLCLMVLMGRQTNQAETFLDSSKVPGCTAREMAKRLSCSDKTVQPAIATLIRRGFAVRASNEGVGWTMYMPKIDGAMYAAVDPAKAMKCFAYGAPEDAWCVLMACTDCPVVNARHEKTGVGKLVEGTSQAKVDVALEWLVSNGLVEKRRLFRDGVAYTQFFAKA